MPAAVVASAISESKNENSWTAPGEPSVSSLLRSCAASPNWGAHLAPRGRRTKSSPPWPHGLRWALPGKAAAKRERETWRESGSWVNFRIRRNPPGCSFCDKALQPTAQEVFPRAATPEPCANRYTVLGATPEQEALVRAQIRVMQPDVYPLRVLLCPTGSTWTRPEPFASMCPPDMRAPCSRTEHSGQTGFVRLHHLNKDLGQGCRGRLFPQSTSLRKGRGCPLA